MAATAKALIAMSGGVDSSVAAFLMLNRGFDCIGSTMLLCQKPEDVADARRVSEKLGLPFHVIDAAAEFQTQVQDRFVQSYESGCTPNPCIDCNRHLKFDYMLQRALELGCDCIVTGHYARIRYDESSGRHLLLKAADAAKDQSYFLACLNQHQLRHAHFPLGELSKAEVRQIAQVQGFVNARKRDSQDICFVPDGDYMAFLERYTEKSYAPGDFLDRDGNVVGQHRGAVGYTLGQRKGLGLAMGEPVYVCSKDMQRNTVTVGPNEALYSKSLIAKDWNWLPFPDLTVPIRCHAKARSRQIEQPAIVYPEPKGFARVEFDDPQRAITPGQAVVLYDGDMVIGSGTITQAI